jgi:hypothetical protein
MFPSQTRFKSNSIIKIIMGIIIAVAEVEEGVAEEV